MEKTRQFLYRLKSVGVSLPNTMKKISDDKVKLIYQKLQDNPYSAKAHYEAGLMYLEQGNLTSALRYFEKAVELDSNLKKASDKIEEIKRNLFKE